MAHLNARAVAVKRIPDALSRLVEREHGGQQTGRLGAQLLGAGLVSLRRLDGGDAPHHPDVGGVEGGHFVDVSGHALQQVAGLAVIGQRPSRPDQRFPVRGDGVHVFEHGLAADLLGEKRAVAGDVQIIIEQDEDGIVVGAIPRPLEGAGEVFLGVAVGRCPCASHERRQSLSMAGSSSAKAVAHSRVSQKYIIVQLLSGVLLT